MADHIHLFHPGASITCAASADVTGGRLVTITGDREVAHAATAAAPALGAAARDTADGDDVLVLRGGVQNLVASAPIAAGARIEPAAGGKVATATGAGCGTALTAATAADQLLQVALDS